MPSTGDAAQAFEEISPTRLRLLLPWHNPYHDCFWTCFLQDCGTKHEEFQATSCPSDLAHGKHEANLSCCLRHYRPAGSSPKRASAFDCSSLVGVHGIGTSATENVLLLTAAIGCTTPGTARTTPGASVDRCATFTMLCGFCVAFASWLG